ncbi:MAG: copper-translocating P-type ATPase [bacterium]|nr:copper-translocating P-type ATPase [bacterium]
MEHQHHSDQPDSSPKEMPKHHDHHEPEVSEHKDHKEHKATSGTDHGQHHQMMIKDYKKRFFVSLIVTFPILFLSPLIQDFLNLEISFAGDKYILFALSAFIFFYGGWPFLKGIVEELKKKQPGMMTLVALAISVAFFYSSAVVFGLEGKFFFWELATLIDVMLLGHWLEMRSILGASRALEELAKLMPQEAHVIKDGKIIDVKITDLKKDDLVLVKAGEKVPADGVIAKGEGYANESMLTGESKPTKKRVGDKVIGGSINGDDVLEISITSTGEDSYLAKVINLVKQAQAAKSKTQRLADRAALVLTIVSISIGVLTFIIWLLLGQSFAFAIERMATVMVITCPHALGLAIPLVVAVSTALSAKNGLLIRNRTAFENSRKISTIIFDKTGTLTMGNFGVTDIIVLNDQYDNNKLLQIAYSLEKQSEHPIAKGIINEAQKNNLSDLQVQDFKVLKGEGIAGKIDGTEFKVVSPSHLSRNNINLPEGMDLNAVATNIFILQDSSLIGVISLADVIREESYTAINQLKELGIKCWMLTGDNKEIAKQVAEELELDGFFAEVLPHEKQEKIKELQAQGEFVAMTGDGINDAPALAQADVGIAIGSGTDVAAETADIILVNSNPKDVTSLILFGKATYKKMVQNLFWATGYNVIAIPLAAGALYAWGILLSPAIGAAFMSLSTIIVAINSKFLKVDKK